MNYYVSTDGSEPSGPYSLTELASMFTTGNFTSTAQVCAEGEQRWMPISSVISTSTRSTQKLDRHSPQKPFKSTTQAKGPVFKASQTSITPTTHSSHMTSSSNTMIGGLIIALLAAILIVPFFHAAPISPPSQWEYLIETIPDTGFSRSMNGFGADGWEVVFARRASDGSKYDPTFSYEVIFKRPKKGDTKA